MNCRLRSASLISSLFLLGATLSMIGCASTTVFDVGPGTEDLVLRPEEPALYTRTASKPAPILDRVGFEENPGANVWRLVLDGEGRIVRREPVLVDAPNRSVVGDGSSISYRPLGLYLHPDVRSTHLYALNASSESPGFFVIHLDSDNDPIRLVRAPDGKQYSKAFAKSNSLAVHPDGTVFVSIFRFLASARGDKQPVVSELEAERLKAPVSILAYHPDAIPKWRVVLWNVPGANGMAFWRRGDGRVDFLLSDYSRKSVLRFDSTDPRALRFLDRTELSFSPDNLTVRDNDLFVAGQSWLLTTVLNISLSSRIPTRSRIVRWNLSDSSAEPVATTLQPQLGPAVATAVPYDDTIFCSQISGREILTLRHGGN